MKINQIRVQNFRNIAFATLAFSKLKVFLFGENGQGKTNLLEAASLLTALRSFRTREQKLLIKKNEKIAQIAVEIEHEQKLCKQIILTLKNDGSKIVELDNGNIISQIGDFVGRFPVVVFSSEDIKLLRGSPTLRRRWFNMTISAVNPNYLNQIQRYKRTLESRNAILKNTATDATNVQLDAFDEILATLAIDIRQTCENAVQEIATFFKDFSKRILKIDVPATLVYKPNVPTENCQDRNEYLALLKRMRHIDFILHATQKGPHRDDFDFLLDGNAAADYASEGQQRAITLALGLSQLAYFRKHTNIAPVILADDVLGELDPARRENFWNEIGSDLQIIATGTEKPNNNDNSWNIFHVIEGNYQTL